MQPPSSDLDGLPEGAADWLSECLPGAMAGAERVRDAPRSVVFRITTDQGRFYFKVDRILPPPEGVVVEQLAKSRPGRVPTLVAVNAERGWSLTGDAGDTGPNSLEHATTADWRAVGVAFGELQCNTGLSAQAWVDLGCRDYRGPKLFAEFRDLLDDAVPALDDDIVATLRTLIPRIEEACDDLANDGVPACLVHQDLVPENLIWTPDRIVFLDWSDTVVGHPFFGLDRLLDSCWSDKDRRSAVIDAYLTAFEGLASPERLQASFARVLWLRVFYEGLRWHHEVRALGPDCEQARRLRADQLAGLTMVARHQA